MTATPLFTWSRLCLYSGATLIHTTESEIECYLKFIEKYSVTVIFMTAPALIELIKNTKLTKYKLSSLETIITGGTPFTSRQTKAFQQRWPALNLYQGYGIIESGVICCNKHAPRGPKPGSVGCVLPGVTMKVVDIATRVSLGSHQQGEICVRRSGMSLFPGYIGGDIERSSYMDEEGFFMTGDLGYYDEDKYFYIVDRIKDVIIGTQSSIAPVELESLLLQHPSVSEAGVVGAPHDKYGEVPVAFVVLQPGADITEQELVDYVDGQVPNFMQLKGGVRFISTLPRVTFNKINKKELRKLL